MRLRRRGISSQPLMPIAAGFLGLTWVEVVPCLDALDGTSSAYGTDRAPQAEVEMLSCLVNKTCAVASLPRTAPQVKESCQWC